MHHTRMLPQAALMVALGMSCAAPEAHAQQDVERILLQQAEQIRQLEARLAALESTPRAHAGDAPATPSPGAESLAARVDALERTRSTQAQVSWSKGAPQFTSADGESTFRLRGRMFVDASATSGSDYALRNHAGTEVRSVRLGAEGSQGTLSWAVEGDFADNGVAWKAAYVALEHTLFGLPADISFGNRLNDRGLDGSSSGANVAFQDRNVVGLGVMPQRGFFGIGIMERVFGQSWHASLQVAGNDLDNAGDNNDSLTWAARAHWNPLKTERTTLHLGGWAFHEDIAAGSSNVVRSAAISGHFNDNVKVVPGPLPAASGGEGFGAELAAVSGPAWAYAEWGRRTVEGVGYAYRVSHDAHAVSLGIFLGGASPAYVAKTGTWGKVKVAQPVTAGGAGAWELKLRHEDVDYRDLPAGGDGNAWTIGANWYLSDMARVMLDVVRWETRNRSGAFVGDDRGYTVNARFQLAF